MPNCFALLSIVFMMGFVLLFDKVHLVRNNARFTENCLLSADDVERLRDLFSACQES